MNKKKEAVIVARGKGFGVRLTATNQKTFYIAKTLSESGFNSYIFSGALSSINNAVIPKKIGRKEGVIYYNSSVLRDRSLTSKIKVGVMYILRMILFFHRVSKTHKNTYLIFYKQQFVSQFVMLLTCKLLGISIIYNIEEWYAAHEDKTWLSRIKNKMYDFISLRASTSVITISDYISERVSKYNPKLKTYILPSLADYNSIDQLDFSASVGLDDQKYFLFCGGLSYIGVINYILEAYRRFIRKEEDEKLVLIVYGKKSAMEQFKNNVSEISKGDIIILNGLTNKELFKWYGNAQGLLAPLRNIEQDKARFPQKIAEYAATGRPIITNSVGDITKYFRDRESALIMDDLDPTALAKNMSFLLKNEEVANKIGAAGRIVGKDHFDYKAHITPLGNFIKDN